MNDLPKLFLVRHGATEWTDTRRHTGLTDIPLNAAGEARARALGERLRTETFSRVYTSPLARARRTCELAGFSARAEADADLVEWDYGAYEGLTTAQILRGRPDWNLFRDGAPGGESPRQVGARADRFIARARSGAGNVVGFSSGHAIRVIAARWLGLGPEAGRYFVADTASVHVLGYEHDRTEPALLLWNQILSG
jgi:probable phosphoglycerate mutase